MKGLSLKLKAVLIISALVLAVAGGLSAYFLRKSKEVLTSKFQTQAESLAVTLAYNCRTPLFSSDELSDQALQQLNDLIAGTLRDSSVLYVMVAGRSNELLAEKFREGKDPSIADEKLRQALLEILARVPEVTSVSANRTQQVYRVAAPVSLEQTRLGSVQIVFSLAQTNAEIRRNILAGGSLTILVILTGIGLGWAFCEYALAPARHMARAAARIADGDFSQRVTVNSGDEIGVLAHNFNRMTESLDQMTRGLEDKVRARTEELQRVNEQLQRATRHKSEFVANMSHELRTPLNSVIGFSEVLLEKMFGPINAKQEEYLTDILTSAKYLLSLINDILDLAKIEAGKMELECSTFNLRQLLEGSLVMVKERAMAHRIHLVLEIEPGIDTLVADERKVKQILFNLLSNAVKFTPDGGRVGIRAGRSEGAVEISVWDTGVGIAAEDQTKIFEEFRQLKAGLAEKPEGTGLGLALTKRFVELHGGTLRVESTHGRGSTFKFTLPDRAPSDAVGMLAPVSTPATSGNRVLIIEDDPKAADILRIYLEEAGYTTELARDGAEGWEKLKHIRPSVVILDVLLPEVDGWEFLTRIKDDPATKDIPVVIVSITDEKGKGFALGASEYLVKPVRKDELLDKLRALRASPARILAIDDDAKTLELLSAVLQSAGFEVVKASDGAEGVRLAGERQPDLVILDLLMPGMNGFDVIERLEASPRTQELPIILFTVKQLTPDEKRRLKGHVAALAEKQAFNKQRFIGLVQEVLRGRN